MLDFLRRSAASWVAKVLFVLLIISFGAWGIGDYLKPNPNRAVATVGDTEISPRQFSQAYRPAVEQLNRRLGRPVTPEMAEQIGLPQEVLQNLIVRALTHQEAQRMGVVVGDDAIRASILANPAFRGADGKFERGRFELLLRNSGYSEQGYVEGLRSEIIARALGDSVGAPAEVPDSMARAIFTFRNEKRSAELMTLPDSAVTPPPPPDEAEVRKYYEAHKDDYRAPEYRTISLLAVTPESMADQHEPTEEQVRAAYESRIAEFRVAGTRTVVQLLYSEQAKAEDARNRLVGGEAPAAVAKETDGKLTDLGKVKETELFPKDLATAAFALKTPGVAPLVKTVLGWHVLDVTAVDQGHEQPFEAVKDQLRRQLAREAAADAIQPLANKIEDKIAGGATLDETAKAFGLEVRHLPPIDRQGMDAKGQKAAGIPEGSDVVASVFDVGQGEDTPVSDLPNGGLYVAHVDKVESTRIKTFDEVKDEAGKAVAKDHLREAGRKEAEALAERVRKGESITDVAQSRGLTVRTPAPFDRFAKPDDGGPPTTIVSHVFGAKQGDVVVAATRDGHVVARVTNVEVPDPAAQKDQVEALRKQLSEPLSTDLQQEYTDALQSRYGVSVDKSALQRQL